MSEWPEHLAVTATRVARPTARLDEVRIFYGDALGLPEIASFENHAGYSGVIFGLPGAESQLEFTSYADGGASPAPSRDNLLVFYFDDADAVDRLRERLAAQGYPTVRPENPYWETVVSSFTVEDPDGWRVVIVSSHGESPA